MDGLFDALSALLRSEVEARRALSEEVLRLTREVDALQGVEPRSPDRDPSAPALLGSSRGDAASAATGERASPDSAQLPGTASAFDSEALREAGVSGSEVARLRERWEELQTDRLDLNHRALREGWFSTPRRRNANFLLELAVRRDVGEESYDAMLYASARPNRVVVSDVLSESGLEKGDLIRSYAGQRIFRPAELQRISAEGEVGERVEVEVERNGILRRLYLERGPVGALLDQASRPPAGR